MHNPEISYDGTYLKVTQHFYYVSKEIEKKKPGN
jgi:hypothetical protein